MNITIEETLSSVDLPVGLLPFLLYPAVLEGPRKATVYIGLAQEDSSLVGTDGTVLKIPFTTQFGATDVDADTFEGAPTFSESDPTISKLDVSVTKQQYVKFSLSKILMENVPSLKMDLVQLQNAANAMVEKLNADISDVVAVGATQYGTTTALTYGDVIDAKAAMKTAGVIQSGDTPYLIVSPNLEAVLLKDDQFISSARYTIGDLNQMVDGEVGKYAGCRVIVDPFGDDDVVYIVPSIVDFGAFLMLVWKRKFTTETEYQMLAQKTHYLKTARYTCAMVQAALVGKIVISASP
jgi:hypothetical protein